MSFISTDNIFAINSPEEFLKIALEIFRYQLSENSIYSSFVNHLGIDVSAIKSLTDIPFLPVEFFKTQTILCGTTEPEITFSSSGTTGVTSSKHHVAKASLYTESFRKGFHYFYGDIKEYTVLALLPSYQEREGSSLIYMVDDLIQQSNNQLSGYFLYDHAELFNVLNELKERNSKVILLGVTYALLDFIETYQINFPSLIVMETGGMKGKRKEIIREELHKILYQGFGVNIIHSEYGMTELLSQAYSKGYGKFECPSWLKVIVRDTNDPFAYLQPGIVGGLNIIDLANINSCSFISTQDLGKVDNEGKFEVIGRFDNTDIRGCNLLIQ